MGGLLENPADILLSNKELRMVLNLPFAEPALPREAMLIVLVQTASFL